MTTYNRINCECLRVHVQFHTQRCFRDSLSSRVSDSDHHVTYAKNFCTNKPVHKIYCWISVRSTQQHTLLHNPKIIHAKTFFAPACHPLNIYRCMTARSIRHHTLLHNPTILRTKTFFAPACHLPQKISSTSKYDSKKLSRKISLFPSVGLGLGIKVRVMVAVRVTVQSDTCLQSV